MAWRPHHVHGVVGHRLPRQVHRLGRLEWQRHQLGARLVRHLYVAPMSTESSAPDPLSPATRIQMGYAVAIPCCSLVINRRLNKIARLESVHKFKHDRIREFFFDIGITLGVPVFQMAIYTVVQGHRFNIFEDIGCMSAVYNTPVAMALVNAWPLAITSISLCYVG
jgi:hypothetical protein